MTKKDDLERTVKELQKKEKYINLLGKTFSGRLCIFVKLTNPVISRCSRSA